MADSEQIQVDAERVLQSQLSMLRGYLRHLVGSSDDAEDLAQEVCLEVLKNPGILVRGDDCGAYLRGIARHLASRHHKRVQRNAVLEEFIELAWSVGRPDTSADTAAIPAEAAMDDQQRALQQCLEQMPERTRGMILMRYDDGLNSNEIGSRMSITGEAARMALARARQALAKCVKQRLAVSGGA
ncbi:MAG TPA: RNA polymerase sigma factor [Planctomycetota bacterium]|nr:RNA polymerase sigma factor [Planctomycetota bacterium]